jgi:hypothetical protein
MGLLSTVMGVVGFGWGISLGLVVGYFVFIYLRSTDVKARCSLSLSLSFLLRLLTGSSKEEIDVLAFLSFSSNMSCTNEGSEHWNAH